MPKLRIALAQTSPVSASLGTIPEQPFTNIDTNLRDIAARVAEAKANGADVVVIPEYGTQGIVDGRQYLTFPAEHIFTFLRKVALNNGVCLVGTVVVGTPHAAVTRLMPRHSPFHHLLDPSVQTQTGEQMEWAEWMHEYVQTQETQPMLKNEAFFIDEKGEMVGAYTKRNLWHPERNYLTAGQNGNRAFDTKWGKAGLLICWDMSHPSDAQALADQGVDLIFVPTYWTATDSHPQLLEFEHEPDYERKMVTSLCFARACETETVWVMCNPGGGGEFMGGSGVWQPLRGRVGGFTASDVGIAYVDIDTDGLKAARELYKIREDFASTALERHVK
ncbi:hypothetical protein CcaverHIS002_0204510 [Cutaneotrichosporon cavernicola]|uniref:CN hydrolase domain-containing protein n=1 Tax=Cutaneotrichosporon cavernicola TaxID=279322 RepID=A0AA48I8L5_9TREE|nr:uncharacterized protein CcaverHIS019_0204470 [Cutaneotrichosporon cavernicola]BEI81291.1 hypothetical protein CcaverHIS002_0204510 [Cutaneotrichosporon cavernicola]BEI89085.1 hypothetical protein CcaverHIS019_0204470 [Cutaneotrichosporon cavernicola]BEI96861.1 hypothetical protein CcaverHIS631_0204500 [Cutaneotrichosporon cavernicola]BEJ04633.1 hypothetical protein CcaverHIS641_0204500 [Cutaneotrichosporon cavernicola]